MEERSLLYEKVPFDQERFFRAYAHLTADEDRHVLLESGRTGRYSIAGIRPFAEARAVENGLEVMQNGETVFLEGKPFEQLEKWMKPFAFSPLPELPDFQGGAIGFISYDYIRHMMDLPQMARDDLQFLLLYFLIFDEWAVFDREKQLLWLMAFKREGTEETLNWMKKEWLEASGQTARESSTKEVSGSQTTCSLTEEAFQAAVKKVQQYIKDGEVSQVNLTVRQSQELSVPALEVYKELRQLNPSPYMGYVHTPGFQIVSGSPELLIKKNGSRVGTRPIGGTRPRGADDKEDRLLQEELLANEKERAEHLMLVDIEKMDLGKVCDDGSVRVDELLAVEKYSHVMHLVSHVSGELSKDKSLNDLVEAVFPGGSITGTPKLRTMEIIEELEPVKRGVYTGSLGWVGFNGDLHLNILIRTMLVKDGVCHVQAGAGIVADSDPEAEYKESLKKAAALWKAKEAAEKRGIGVGTHHA
jgi:para-aminobenzoate synthetase component 1